MTTINESHDVSRRKVLVAGAGAAALGVLTRHVSFAQDATPSATEAEAGAAQEGSAGASPEAALPAIPPEVIEYANDWPVAQGNLAATRVAASTTIDSTTVGTLDVAWTLPISAQSGFGGMTSNPIVLGDTVYIEDNGSNIQSVDKETGAVNWTKAYNIQTTGPNGLALGYGYLVAGLGDSGTVAALDPETGEEIWSFQLTNHRALGINQAPLIYDGAVIISTEPGGNEKGVYEGGAAGILFALKIDDGETLWQWDTTQNLWNNFAVNSGGGLWYPPSVDENGILYLGVANAAPFPDASTRPGDNDYANNTVALDPKAGGVKWAINIKPHDLIDADNQQTPVLGSAEIDGVETDIVFSSGKYGYVVAINRESGEEIWRTPVGKHENDDLTELPEDPVIIFPGLFGGVESPIAVKDGIVYVAALNAGTGWSASALDYESMDLGASTGNVTALDGATGKVIWDVEVPTGIAGAGPTVANDVVFVGGLDGIVRGYNIADGTLVWSYQTTAGLNAPFAVAGDYLFVPAGSFILPSSDTQGEPPAAASALYAFKLGA